MRVGVVPRSDLLGRFDILTAPGMGKPAAVKRFDAITQMEIDSFFAYDQDFKGGAFVAGG